MYKRQNSCSVQQNQIKIIFPLPFFSPLHTLAHHVVDFSTTQNAIHLQRFSTRIQHEKQHNISVLNEQYSFPPTQTKLVTLAPLPARDFQITASTPFHELPTLLHPEENWQFLIIKLMVNRKVISSRRMCLHKAIVPLHIYYSTRHYWLMWSSVPKTPVNLALTKSFNHSTLNSLS
jgi:hypothetical protein